MTGRRIRAAIVGSGNIAEVTHVPALRAQGDRVDLVAAVDIDADQVKAFCERTGIPRGYTSPQEVLDAEHPDLAHVCTPPATHVDLVVGCLDAGAWVLMEKPPTLSLAEYDRIEAAERDGGPYASVVFQHRFGSAGRHAAELIGSGELGRPLVAACNTLWYRPQEYFDVPWRGKWATEGGGPTMGHGIHQMDLLLAMLGDWSEVTAMAGRLDRVTETEDVSMAVARFENGAERPAGSPGARARHGHLPFGVHRAAGPPQRDHARQPVLPEPARRHARLGARHRPRDKDSRR